MAPAPFITFSAISATSLFLPMMEDLLDSGEVSVDIIVDDKTFLPIGGEVIVSENDVISCHGV